MDPGDWDVYFGSDEKIGEGIMRNPFLSQVWYREDDLSLAPPVVREFFELEPKERTVVIVPAMGGGRLIW